MNPTIFLLHGHPGTGKLSVARAMLSRMDVTITRIVDNQYVNLPIFNLLDVDGVKPVPGEAWDRIAEVRNAIVATIEDLSPKSWSFIFTNYLVDEDEDRDWSMRLQQVAEARDSQFVPVKMDCSLEQLLIRVTRPDRSIRMKLIDEDWVRENYDPGRLLDIVHPNLIEVDTTNVAPDEIASQVLWESTSRAAPRSSPYPDHHRRTSSPAPLSHPGYVDR